MIEARVVRSIEVIIHEHICPLPDLPAIRPRPARSVKRLQERDRKARLDYCGVLDVTLIVPSLGAFEILPTKGKLEGTRSRDLTTLSAAPCEHQSIWIVWENARSGSIVTFWRRTAVLVPQRSRAAQSVLAGIEQVFSVLSHVEASTGGKKQPFTPAETKSSLCHHAFVGKILVRAQSYGQGSSR